MNAATLYIFSISHYCEKARWALDCLGIEYRVKAVAPGAHIALAKKLGAGRSSVPILVVGGTVIQGSSQIIDWAEQQVPVDAISLAPEKTRLEEARKIEKRLDDKIGVHIRRMFYSEALVEHPQTVKPVFNEGLSFFARIRLALSWPVIVKAMIKRMDLGQSQGAESKAIIEAELDWLDSLLEDGREYLVGDKFSRVDITAASLLARIVMPKKHPGDGRFKQPPRLQLDAANWVNRPSLQWVAKMYTQHR